MASHVKTSLDAARIGIAVLLLLIAFFVGLPGVISLASQGRVTWIAVLIAALAMIMIACKIRRFLAVENLAFWLEESSAPIKDWADNIPAFQLHRAIVLIAGLTLFLELVLIRWQASLFAVFALYKNFTLLACFCGLGIGYALCRRTPLLLALALPALAVNLLLLSVLRYGSSGFMLNFLYVVPAQESAVFSLQTANGFWDRLVIALPVYLLLIGTFLLNALALLPVGQFCGYLMERCEPLKGYGFNLLGSILGVILIFTLSCLWAGPVVWFGISAFLLMMYLMPSPPAQKPGIVAAALCVLVAGWPSEPLIEHIYSPYQLIEKATQPDGLMVILSAGSYYQKVHNLSLTNPNRETDPALRRMAGYYDLPFKVAPSPGNVVIVGAGSGNDIAAALRAGAAHVDAVEIDPVIRDLGRQNHPEHPYDDPKVRSIVTDARTFFRNSHDSYDAIVYGVLDSHVLLSHGSNVRVDSFVYTQQGFKDAYDHLKPGGLMSVAFALVNDAMGHKIYRMLKNLPGAGEPLALNTDPHGKGTTFLVRKDAAVTLPQDFVAHYGQKNTTAMYAQSDAAYDLPTDDWPFFYMDSKMFPATYVFSLVLILVLSVILVLRFLPTRKFEIRLLPFFFLGAGFMLVETKAITELGLIFGNTWQVVGITIISVLVMAWCANALAGRISVPVAAAYALLIGVIVLGYAVAIHGGIGNSDALSKLCMLLLLTSPLLFSGLAFSTLLRNTGSVADAMAYNLMGAMLGGVLEYNSMQYGFAFLYLVALILYGLAWVTSMRRAV